MAVDDDKTQVFVPGAKAKSASPFRGRSPNAKLVCQDVSFLEDGSTSFEIALSGAEITVGREEGNVVTIRSKQLSRRHARIYPGDGQWGIADMDSKNGTWVNDSSIKETWLSPGDIVKIGPIPFKYELERPEVESLSPHGISETIVDKTMLVGSDVRAASALLRAAEKATAGEPPPPPRAAPSRPGKTAATPSGPAVRITPAKRRGGVVKPIVIGIVALLVLGGGGYLGWSHFSRAELRNVIEANQRDIKRFMSEHEQEVGDFDRAENQQQLDALRGMASGVDESTRKYTDSPELREQQMQLLFLTFERRLMELLDGGAVEEAEQLHAEATDALGRIKSSVTADRREFRGTHDEIAGLLRLAKAVIELKRFALAYPEPSAGAANRPDQTMLDEMADWRRQFAEEKRANNLALSVRYRYFARTVNEVDGTDLRVLDRWQQLG
jgi:hypothetical protein